MSKDDDGKEEDCDELFLDQVLNKLYDFGDGPASKRKRTSQKKKSKKRCEEEVEGASDDDARVMKAGPEEPRGVGDTETGHPEPSNAAGTGSAPPQLPLVEVVTFQDPTKKPKTTRKTSAPETKTPQMKEKKKDPENPKDFSLEKARLEVHRFGITGYQKAQQRVFEQERAVMLGARPPKKEYVNYKVLQQTIKDKKQKVKEEVPTDLKKKKKSKPRDEKRKSSSGSAPTGQVGRFKNGMLVLNSKDIQKIKAKR